MDQTQLQHKCRLNKLALRSDSDFRLGKSDSSDNRPDKGCSRISDFIRNYPILSGFFKLFFDFSLNFSLFPPVICLLISKCVLSKPRINHNSEFIVLRWQKSKVLFQKDEIWAGKRFG